MIYYNTRSILKGKNKIDRFLIDIERMPNATAISEAKLSANSSLNLNFPNYKFIRNDSIMHSSGLGLYMKDSLRFKLRKDLICNVAKIYG